MRNDVSQENKTKTILQHPDIRLRMVCNEVQDDEFGSEELMNVSKYLINSLYHSGGIGLAAPQIGIDRRVFVVKYKAFGNDTFETYVNPQIEIAGKEMFSFKEGCLSIPGVFATVRRPKNIIVTARKVNGTEFTHEASGLMSTVIQHEYDHLNGVEFIDRLSKLKKKRLAEKLMKDKGKINENYLSIVKELRSNA